MEVLPESLDLHGAEHGGNWKVHALEHSLWLISRALLLLFIVAVAFFSHIPFQRLLQRDVALEMEESEKERMLSQFKLIDSLSLSALKFQATLDDLVTSLLRNVHANERAAGDSFTTKLHRSEDAYNSLRELFETRQIPLDPQLQEATQHLIEDGDDALNKCQLIGSEVRSGGKSAGLTFQAEKALISIDIADIIGYEQTYATFEQYDNPRH